MSRERSTQVAAPTLDECNDTSDFGQGVGTVGPWRVASCRWCHALVLYHSWKAHKHWHHMNADDGPSQAPISRPQL